MKKDLCKKIYGNNSRRRSSLFSFQRAGVRVILQKKGKTMENTNLILGGEAMRLWWIVGVVVAEYVLVLAAVGADMTAGIRKARSRGEATRSRALRRTVDKLARYYNVLVVLSVVDAMQIAGAWFLRAVEGYNVPTVPLFTLLGSIGMAAIEVKSIFEKGTDKERGEVGELLDLLETATGNAQLQKIIDNLKTLKR